MLNVYTCAGYVGLALKVTVIGISEPQPKNISTEVKSEAIDALQWM